MDETKIMLTVSKTICGVFFLDLVLFVSVPNGLSAFVPMDIFC